jgi:hypothetical protein
MGKCWCFFLNIFEKSEKKSKGRRATKIKADTAVNSTQYAIRNTQYDFLDRIYRIYRDKI